MISQSTGSYYPLVAYEYDAQSQLVKETYYNGNGTGSSNITATYTYTYDTAGNLLSVKKDGTTVQTYTYGDTAWKDLLTAFNGKAITYDASGNPLTYGSWDLAWQNGRQLSTAEKTEGMTDTTLSYAYDASGIRTSKTYTVETNTNQYTVTFVADGTTVKTMTVYGGYILQDSDYPSVPAKTGYNGSWQQYTAEIHTDVTIQATYTIKTYSVTFKRGTLMVARKTFAHGYVLNDSDYPTAPTGYEWERYTQPICSNIVIHAIETTGSGEKYTVTFWASGQLLKTMIVGDGYVLKDSDYPAVPPRTGYTGSWNKYTGAIHESITITARYTKNGSVAMSVGDETELLTSDIAAEEDLTPVQDSGEADAPAAQAGQTLVSTQTVRHDYVTQNGKVVRETVTTDGTVTAVMDFIYDESGSPFALRHSTNGSSFTTYYYVLNLQGDVVKLVNANGTAYATYTYNAWGEVLTATGSMASINPLRYRGYYYDTETGFYYLQSRYYDPITHRFINADSYASTGQGFVSTNMFVYCGNNPVIFDDSKGHVRNYCVRMTDGGGGKPKITIENNKNAQVFYETYKSYIFETSSKYTNKESTYDIYYKGSFVVSESTRRTQKKEAARATARFYFLASLYFGPGVIPEFTIKQGYDIISLIVGSVAGGIDYLQPDNTLMNGDYQMFTVFIDTPSEMYGEPCIETVVLDFYWVLFDGASERVAILYDIG